MQMRVSLISKLHKDERSEEESVLGGGVGVE